MKVSERFKIGEWVRCYPCVPDWEEDWNVLRRYLRISGKAVEGVVVGASVRSTGRVEDRRLVHETRHFGWLVRTGLMNKPVFALDGYVHSLSAPKQLPFRTKPWRYNG